MAGRILVVDDEKAILVALRGLFTKEGYAVETASSGEEAVRLIETGSFHVVVTDLSMEGLSLRSKRVALPLSGDAACYWRPFPRRHRAETYKSQESRRRDDPGWRLLAWLAGMLDDFDETYLAGN